MNREPSSDSNQGDLEDFVYSILSRAAVTLGAEFERSDLDLEAQWSPESGDPDLVDLFEAAGPQLGLAVQETNLRDAREIVDLVKDGFPVVLVMDEADCLLLRRMVGRNIEAWAEDSEGVSSVSMSRAEIRKFLSDPNVRVLVVKEELECDGISASPIHGGDAAYAAGMSPIRRFLGLLRMDARDVALVALFSLVAGALSLATPLAVESLVNVVSWGIYLQPLFVLALMLLICLGISAALRILETIVVEIIQRRQLVRIVSDLAHRFPRADQDYLKHHYPRELANRVFDIMTIQKATAILLLDGVSILITTILGLLLLAFYHPFLLGFDIVLLLSMVCITWLLGRGGVRTAIKESKTKYNIAHWLQDILDAPEAFRVNGGEALAIDRASRLATDYVKARKNQFRVVLRQIIFAIGLQVIASTVLLGLGGWLVIQGQLTLGQLVASELVVTVVVGAFAKAGKSLEKYYDMMAAIDKVGQLLDIPADRHDKVAFSVRSPLSVKWDDIKLTSGSAQLQMSAQELAPGSQTAFVTDTPHALARMLTGLIDPQSGFVEVDGVDVKRLAVGCHEGQAIGLATKQMMFHGTIEDVVGLGRACVGRGRIREVLQLVDAWDDINRLEKGLQTPLQTGGHPLSKQLVAKLIIAQALAGHPGVLILEGVLEDLPRSVQSEIVKRLSDPAELCTLLVVTRNQDVAAQCEQVIELEKS